MESLSNRYSSTVTIIETPKKARRTGTKKHSLSNPKIALFILPSQFRSSLRSKSSEPILEFLQDPKREAKANQTLEAAKKQITDSGEKNPKGVFNLDKVTVLPPISRPTKIICMGGNFSDHLQEGSTSLPPFPISFLKSPTSLVGHRAPVFYPGR